MDSLEIEMIERIRAAWDAHAAECTQSPKAVLLHPGNHSLIGWDEVFGVPVLPDARVEPKRFLLVCGVGHGGYCARGQVWWDQEGMPYVRVSPPEAA